MNIFKHPYKSAPNVAIKHILENSDYSKSIINILISQYRPSLEPVREKYGNLNLTPSLDNFPKK